MQLLNTNLYIQKEDKRRASFLHVRRHIRFKNYRLFVACLNLWFFSCTFLSLCNFGLFSNLLDNRQLSTTNRQRDLGVIITKDFKWQNNREKLQNCQHNIRVHCQQHQVQKNRNDLFIIQISCTSTSRICSTVLFAHLR